MEGKITGDELSAWLVLLVKTKRVSPMFFLWRFCVCEGQTGESVDVPDPEGHRQSRLLPVLLSMVDPGYLQNHFPLAAGSLSAARCVSMCVCPCVCVCVCECLHLPHNLVGGIRPLFFVSYLQFFSEFTRRMNTILKAWCVPGLRSHTCKNTVNTIVFHQVFNTTDTSMPFIDQTDFYFSLCLSLSAT